MLWTRDQWNSSLSRALSTSRHEQSLQLQILLVNVWNIVANIRILVNKPWIFYVSSKCVPTCWARSSPEFSKTVVIAPFHCLCHSDRERNVSQFCQKMSSTTLCLIWEPKHKNSFNPRCITRLDEVLRCIKDVARIVGDVDFEAKMERASLTIKRDIVFAASLYVQ